jgi:hypothetical protein
MRKMHKIPTSQECAAAASHDTVACACANTPLSALPVTQTHHVAHNVGNSCWRCACLSSVDAAAAVQHTAAKSAGPERHKHTKPQQTTRAHKLTGMQCGILSPTLYARCTRVGRRTTVQAMLPVHQECAGTTCSCWYCRAATDTALGPGQSLSTKHLQMRAGPFAGACWCSPPGCCLALLPHHVHDDCEVAHNCKPPEAATHLAAPRQHMITDLIQDLWDDLLQTLHVLTCL